MIDERHLCGRPTKTGKPCGQRRNSWAVACNRHLTEEETAEIRRQDQELRDRIASYGRPPIPMPECWSWPVTDADRELGSIRAWQDDRCAVCGERGGLVTDHDHETGWIRGHLCRGCNTSEGSSAHRVFQRYRRWHPAKMLGIWKRYVNPFHGTAPTQWQGQTIYRPVPISLDGVVLFEAYNDRSPVHVVSRALLGGSS